MGFISGEYCIFKCFAAIFEEIYGPPNLWSAAQLRKCATNAKCKGSEAQKQLGEFPYLKIITFFKLGWFFLAQVVKSEFPVITARHFLEQLELFWFLTCKIYEVKILSLRKLLHIFFQFWYLFFTSGSSQDYDVSLDKVNWLLLIQLIRRRELVLYLNCLQTKRNCSAHQVAVTLLYSIIYITGCAYWRWLAGIVDSFRNSALSLTAVSGVQEALLSLYLCLTWEKCSTQSSQCCVTCQGDAKTDTVHASFLASFWGLRWNLYSNR